MVALFVVQPKIAEGGFPQGYHLLWTTFDTGNGQSAWTALYPDYAEKALSPAVPGGRSCAS